MDFGVYLRKLRKNKGLTLQALAEASGVSQTYITNIENGKRGAPSPEILKKLSQALGSQYIELLNKAGYVSENLIRRDSLEFTSTKIGMAILDVLREMKHTNKYTKEAAEEFQKDLIHAIKTDETTVSDLKRHLFDMEPDGELIPRIGDIDQTNKIENLLELLEKAVEDDLSLRILKRQIEIEEDISIYLERSNVKYNGHALMPEDKKRILDMLKALFPEYQETPTAADPEEV